MGNICIVFTDNNEKKLEYINKCGGEHIINNNKINKQSIKINKKLMQAGIVTDRVMVMVMDGALSIDIKWASSLRRCLSSTSCRRALGCPLDKEGLPERTFGCLPLFYSKLSYLSVSRLANANVRRMKRSSQMVNCHYYSESWNGSADRSGKLDKSIYSPK